MNYVFSTILRHKKFFKISVTKTNHVFNLQNSDQDFKSFSTGTLLQKNRSNNGYTHQKQVPTLLYIQNPITWLINKIDFKMLKNAWDPDFDENEFKRGTIQAVSVICTLISNNLWDNLRGLITRPALIRLHRDVEVNWTDEQRRNIHLEPTDVKLALPRKVHFLKIADQKFVDVDMMFVAMKFMDSHLVSRNDLIIVELVARFHRNYTPGELPNWTVTIFQVTRFSGGN